MKHKLLIVTILLSLGPALLVWQQAAAAKQEFRVAGAGLEATPTSYTSCPAPVRFKGQIQASGGAGRVKYTYSYSDGASRPEGFVDFDGPGIKFVETTWLLGDITILPHYDGWAILKYSRRTPS